ncbi:MAG TPA: Fe-S oxidoreductase, partial [Acidimicrobiales bacterium]|nr:Fe-S oxidoreductase [Acidimicrobiales bacterium]
MLARIVIGLVITIVGFGVAGQRFYWLSRLIRSGQPAPRRWQGLRKVADAELSEVAGQRKLLRWTVPGLAHFFTMWGFTVLLTTILEAYG